MSESRSIEILCPHSTEPKWRVEAAKNAETAALVLGDLSEVTVDPMEISIVKATAKGFSNCEDLQAVAEAISTSFGGQFPVELVNSHNQRFEVPTKR